MSQCPDCGDYFYNTPHKCLPKWECRIENYHADDEWVEHRGYSSESVAESLAEEHDADERGLLRGEDMVIAVKEKDGSITRYDITAEATANYYARVMP